MSTSIAVSEAFDLLNAGARFKFRGWGDTLTAARDRAAEDAGVTPAQAERLWKNWRTMKSVNGDVYRSLRNAYSHLCEGIENAAERMEQERQEIEGRDAIDNCPVPAGAGVARAAEGAEKRETFR